MAAGLASYNKLPVICSRLPGGGPQAREYIVPGPVVVDSSEVVKVRATGQGTTSIAHASSGAWLCLKSGLERRWPDEHVFGLGQIISLPVSRLSSHLFLSGKIGSSILGCFVFIVYLHASASDPFSGMPTLPPFPTGLQCHCLQEAHLSSLTWSWSCKVRLLSYFHCHTERPSRAGTV